MLAFLKTCWKSTVSVKAPMAVNNIGLASDGISAGSKESTKVPKTAFRTALKMGRRLVSK
jgi:hypothetical protein